ncbi:MAG: ABC transporter permease subunit [Planctomycetes bacterium]|nr:ABC transporter permease subunit [Planctomycetota bacterium]
MTDPRLQMLAIGAGALGVAAAAAGLLRLVSRRGYVTFARELAALLFQPVGWIVLLLLYLFRGYEVVGLLTQAGLGPVDREQFTAAYLQTSSSLLMLLLVPAILTMRSFADEKRSGSLEVLLTAPVRDGEIVLGKWLAAAVYFGLIWLPAILLLVLLGGPQFLAAEFPIQPVLSGYLGIVLVGALFLAVGCFTSSLTDNQLLAALIGILFAFGTLFGPRYVEPFLQLRAAVPDAPGLGATAARVLGDEIWRGDFDGFGALLEVFRDTVLFPFVQRASVGDHLANWFFRGLLNTGQIVFYVVGTGCFLFLTTRSLDLRRWR